MKFLFMDETYMARRARGSATSLTGLLVPAASHARVRDRFQALLKPVGATDGQTLNRPIDVHAADLFKDLGVGDEVRLAFLNGVAQLCLDHEFKIYRIGYYNDAGLPAGLDSEKALLGLCFVSMLWTLGDELRAGMIWPIMERDGSAEQDNRFAGQVRSIDYYTAHLGSGAMSVDNQNLGELFYSTKHSAYGALVDCVAYLRHVTHLETSGVPLSPFKRELASISSRFTPIIARDETVRLQNADALAT